MGSLARTVGLLLAVTSAPALAQNVRGIVVDQTGLPLPGATVHVLDGATVVATETTGNDGTFAIDDALAGDVVTVSLHGFEPARIPRADASRIVLLLARASETTTVVAPAESPSPAAPLFG